MYAPSVTSAILRSVSPSSLLITGLPSCISVVFAPVFGSVSVISLPVSLPRPTATIFTPASRAAFAASSRVRILIVAVGDQHDQLRALARREAAQRGLDRLADARAAACRRCACRRVDEHRVEERVVRRERAHRRGAARRTRRARRGGRRACATSCAISAFARASRFGAASSASIERETSSTNITSADALRRGRPSRSRRAPAAASARTTPDDAAQPSTRPSRSSVRVDARLRGQPALHHRRQERRRARRARAARGTTSAADDRRARARRGGSARRGRGFQSKITAASAAACRAARARARRAPSATPTNHG